MIHYTHSPIDGLDWSISFRRGVRISGQLAGMEGWEWQVVRPLLVHERWSAYGSDGASWRIIEGLELKMAQTHRPCPWRGTKKRVAAQEVQNFGR
jgi:hypothetical protein